MDPGCRRSATSIPDDISTHTYADARRLALDRCDTRVRQKDSSEATTSPCGRAEDLIKHFLKGKDQATGDTLNKRQGAAFIPGELEKLGTDRAVIQMDRIPSCQQRIRGALLSRRQATCRRSFGTDSSRGWASAAKRAAAMTPPRTSALVGDLKTWL